MHAAPLVALVGNPNAGKSALFNALTGARQKVGNYPGVTVERHSGRLVLDDGRPVELIDLPGAYSLEPSSPDERVTRDVVTGASSLERLPDALVVVVDAANLDNHLRFTLQLIALGLPVVVALNMVDLAERDGLTLDAAVLERELGVPVIATVAVRKRGLDGLRALAVLGVLLYHADVAWIPGGFLGDWIGPRKVILRIVLWWSFFTAATGWVRSFWPLVGVRFLFGAGEAGCFPNLAKVFSLWLPGHERVRAQPLREGALRHEFEFDLAGVVQTLEHVRAGRTREGTHDAAHGPGLADHLLHPAAHLVIHFALGAGSTGRSRTRRIQGCLPAVAYRFTLFHDDTAAVGAA